MWAKEKKVGKSTWLVALWELCDGSSVLCLGFATTTSVVFTTTGGWTTSRFWGTGTAGSRSWSGSRLLLCYGGRRRGLVI